MQPISLGKPIFNPRASWASPTIPEKILNIPRFPGHFLWIFKKQGRVRLSPTPVNISGTRTGVFGPETHPQGHWLNPNFSNFMSEISKHLLNYYMFKYQGIFMILKTWLVICMLHSTWKLCPILYIRFSQPIRLNGRASGKNCLTWFYQHFESHPIDKSKRVIKNVDKTRCIIFFQKLFLSTLCLVIAFM